MSLRSEWIRVIVSSVFCVSQFRVPLLVMEVTMMTRRSKTVQMASFAGLLAITAGSLWAASYIVDLGECKSDENICSKCSVTVATGGASCTASRCTGMGSVVHTFCKNGSQGNCNYMEGSSQDATCTNCLQWTCAMSGQGHCSASGGPGVKCRCEGTSATLNGGQLYDSDCVG